MDGLAPIRKQIYVARAPDEAFKLFTDDIGSWWPLETHSLGREQAETAIVELRVGGRMYERWRDGQERDWGDVLVFDPPHRLVVSWRVNPNRSAPTEWEVRFIPEGTGTRVELEHRGWERLQDEDRAEARADYDSGWDLVLGRYVGSTA